MYKILVVEDDLGIANAISSQVNESFRCIS